MSVLREPDVHQELQHGTFCPIFGVDPFQVKGEEPTIHEYANVSLPVRRPFAKIVLAG
jgi:hypothetical protein